MSSSLPVLSPASAATTLSGTPTSPWRSVPGKLWLRMALIALLAVAVALTGLLATRFFSQIARTLGSDAVPSIVAAEKIRTRLADAHTDLMNVFLTHEPQGAAMQAYDESIAQAHDHLLTASQNITYGDDERKPILAVMTLLSQYERLVGRALVATDYTDALGQADVLMRGRILPAVTALDEANYKHLDAAWQDEKAKSRLWLLGYVATAALLVGALVEIQLKLYATFRRIINRPLAAALIAVIACAIAFGITGLKTMEDIRSAKEDAFDSVHALARAEAQAFVANAHESIYLLLHGRPEQAAQTELFHAAASAMFSAKLPADGSLPANLGTLKGTGFLGDELANITYVGEDQLARTELQYWLEYVQIDDRIRALEVAGQHAQAVALCLGMQPQQSDWAFERAVGALRATLRLNEDQFASTIARASDDARMLGLLLLPLLVAPLLGAALGLRPRLAEFRA